MPLTFSRSPLPYGPFRSYNAETWATDGGDVALGHVTNYAQNMDGMVWDLAMLEAHLGESHLCGGGGEGLGGTGLGCARLGGLGCITLGGRYERGWTLGLGGRGPWRWGVPSCAHPHPS